MTLSLSKTKSLVAVMMLCILFSPVLAQEPPRQEIWVPLADSPTGEPGYYQPIHPPQVGSDPSWAVRTGAKKGILDRVTDEEKFAGPDAAVLKNGFYGPWQSLLAQFREPSVLVEPSRIAGLAKTKPYLIIPSGGLHGLSGSRFFKAGLSEYVMSGGVILCFAQQLGADLSSLPVPEGSKLEIIGAGWAEDAGPMFRASSVQDNHSMLAGTTKTAPDIETNGYLITLPRGSKVLLSRSDKHPTLIVYPCGAGWVVVTTIFPDFSFEYGRLEPDEKTLVRDILRWAKAPAQTVAASPGEKLDLTLTIHGSEEGGASAVKLKVMGPEGDNPISEEIIKVSVKEYQTAALPYTYTVPAAALQPGIYHLEYLLLNDSGEAIGEVRESDANSFSIGQPTLAIPLLRSAKPSGGIPVPVRSQASLEHSNGTYRLTVGFVPDTRAPASLKQAYVLRAAGQEKLFAINTANETVSLDIPEQNAGEMISYKLYHSSGRVIARGSVPVPVPPAEMISFDKQPAFAGAKASALLVEPGSGELTLAAPGNDATRMITEGGKLDFTLPADLPAGTYRLRWAFMPLSGPSAQGNSLLNIDGYRVRVLNASLDNRIVRDAKTFTARLRIHATRKTAARIKLLVRGPEGRTVPVAEQDVMLQEGPQDVPVAFSFTPVSAGISDLQYTITALLPEGLSSEPIDIAAGRLLFDIGETAVLGVAAARPIYYEPTGPVDVSAYITGRGKTRLELFLDNNKVRKEKLDLSGPFNFNVPLPGVGPGSHTVKVVVAGDKLESSEQQTFVYGARIPDLAVSLMPAVPTGTVMHVGLDVRNKGKSAAPQSRAALYEGDPARGGKLIAMIDVPPLDPGKTYASIIDWPLNKKAGIRTLAAVADVDNAVAESNKTNNTVSAEVKVPDLLFTITPLRNAFTSDEKLPVELLAANLTTAAYKDLLLEIELVNRSGKVVSSDSVPITELAVGGEQRISRGLSLAQFPGEKYQIRARVMKNGMLATASSTIDVLPTLLVSGRLDTTAQTAALCSPLDLRYSIQNAGNIPVSSGAFEIEITNAQSGQPAFARQLPFTTDPAPIRIDNVYFAPGEYTISLKASVSNTEHKMTRELMLAKQSLTVSTPLRVKKGVGSVPRVLVWRSRVGTTIQQAIAEKIVQQAFEEGVMYYTTVEKGEDFINKAMSGTYNTAVLFETDDVLEQSEWLRDRVEHGLGLVIIGSGDRTRTIAETLGFTFSEISTTGAMLAFTDSSGFGLSGTLPVSGKFLLPQKKNAEPAAIFAGDKRTAMLLDRSGGGRVMLMPFSFTRSALDTGTSSLYSLLLRAVIRAIEPETEDRTGITSTEVSVSTVYGLVRSRVVVTLPADSAIIWTNEGGIAKNNTVTYDLTAGTDVRKLLCLYRPPSGSKTAAVAELFYECNGKFESQGRIE